MLTERGVVKRSGKMVTMLILMPASPPPFLDHHT
jgi:hypothetical protein